MGKIANSPSPVADVNRCSGSGSGWDQRQEIPSLATTQVRDNMSNCVALMGLFLIMTVLLFLEISPSLNYI